MIVRGGKMGWQNVGSAVHHSPPSRRLPTPTPIITNFSATVSLYLSRLGSRAAATQCVLYEYDSFNFLTHRIRTSRSFVSTYPILRAMVASIQVTVPATGNRISIPSGLFINNQFVPSQETITIVHRSADLLLVSLSPFPHYTSIYASFNLPLGQNYLMCVPDCTSFLGRFCKAAAREAFKTSLTLIPGLVLPLARTHSLGNNFYTSLNLSFDYPHHKAWRRTMFIVSHDASVEGFGEWRILISTRADRNIREAKKKDSKLFRIIMKKIR